MFGRFVLVLAVSTTLWALVASQNEVVSYDVIQKFSGFELRRYPATYWISTRAGGDPEDLVRIGMATRLKDYVDGSNAAKKRFPFSFPITHTFTESASGRKTFQLSFPFGSNKPPVPTKSEVFIEQRPAMEVYVRQFNIVGFNAKEETLKNVKALRQSLASSGINDAVTKPFYSAGYGLPFQSGPRRAEVWFTRQSTRG